MSGTVFPAIAGLRFAPLLPPRLLIVLAAIAVLVLVLALLRRARGAVWRAAGFALLLLWLAGPMLVAEQRQALPDIGLLVTDRSASMQVGDRARLAEAARAAIAREAARDPNLVLRQIEVTDSEAGGTRLFAAISRALADIPPARFAGTIAITDGVVHDLAPGMKPPAMTSPGGAPFSVLIPARGEEVDRTLSILTAPGYGIVGKSVTLRYVVRDLGAHEKPGTIAHITINRDGEAPITRDAEVGQPQSLTLPIARAGPSVVEIAAAPLAGEASTLNNRAVVTVQGVRDRLRVLLISGEPNPGERAWRRLLKSDPAVDLVHFTILRPPEKDDLTPLNQLSLIAFPVHELFVDKIGDFDLIILDRFQNSGLLPLPYLANIAARVRDGGALLLSVGPEFAGGTSLAATPLAGVLPGLPVAENGVVTGAFRPRVTDLGQRHPVTADLSGANPPHAPNAQPTWGAWYRHIVPENVQGQVVMQAPDGDPLLILRHVGKGRTALLLSDQIWLWARGHQGGGPQAELLRRLAHWLMQEPELDGNALTAHVDHGVLHIEQRSTAPAPASPVIATATGPDGQAVHVPLRHTAPGRAGATLPATQPGVWRVEAAGRIVYAAAPAADPLEFADLRATATILGGLARASGGGVVWLARPDGTLSVPDLRRPPAGAPAAGDGWVGLWRRGAYEVTGASAVALLPGWAALGLILAVLSLAWWREGR